MELYSNNIQNMLWSAILGQTRGCDTYMLFKEFKGSLVREREGPATGEEDPVGEPKLTRLVNLGA